MLKYLSISLELFLLETSGMSVMRRGNLVMFK
jgi:hypothetical protein